MNWIKKGLIFNKSHTQLPIAFKVKPGEIRLFYSSRNSLNQSEIDYIDVDEHNPQKILREGGKAFASEPSWFDKTGAMTSCIVQHDKFYMFYTGWNRGPKYYYQHCIGLATSENGDTFERIPQPVIESTEEDYYICSSPYVLIENNMWRMWYISGRNCEGWIGDTPLYSIRYAESKDGYQWKQHDVYFPRGRYELFARPFVVHEHKYQMWYSWLINEIRPKEYHIGYAESYDGLSWARFDNENIIKKSEEGWDSQMVAFPYLLDNFMFYSGNHFGKGGMGYAVRA